MGNEELDELYRKKDPTRLAAKYQYRHTGGKYARVWVLIPSGHQQQQQYWRVPSRSYFPHTQTCARRITL